MSDFEIDESSPVAALENALIEFTGCINDALPDVCSVGFTLGESYVPFDPDPEEGCKADDVACSQAWIRAVGVQPKAGAVVGFSGQDCAMTLTVDLEVGILRCIKTPPRGKAPTATDVLVYGMQALADMNTILCAALNCGVWDEIFVGQWSPTGPLGGQYGGIWSLRVEL